MRTPKRQRAGDDASSRVPAGSGIEVSLVELAALRLLAVRLDPARPRRVAARLSGTNRSAIRGRGMEFAEVRAYTPGDEVRHIDWRVTARTGLPHSKLFEEERERPAIVVADMRAPMRFGTRQCFKSVAVARVAALRIWAAVSRGDRVGGVTLSGVGLRTHRLRRDRHATRALIEALADATSVDREDTPVALADALMEVRRMARPGTEIFVCSDFSDLDASASRHLTALAQGTHTTCVLVHDPLECESPMPGQYRVSDGERVVTLGLGSASSRAAWTGPFEARLRELERLCRDGGALLEVVSTASADLGLPSGDPGDPVPTGATAANAATAAAALSGSAVAGGVS